MCTADNGSRGNAKNPVKSPSFDNFGKDTTTATRILNKHSNVVLYKFDSGFGW